MSGDDLVARIVAGAWSDPRTGRRLAVPFRDVRIARGLVDEAPARIAALGLGRHLAVVSDANTRAVLGERLERALASVVRVSAIELPGTPHADDATVAALRRASAAADALIAVGAGTINDLCKYAAFLDAKPFAVFGTAPSMNGYTSLTAAVTIDGVKRSLPAHAARGVYLDLDVLAEAPVHLIRSGLGDSLCRPTAQVDWMMAHHLRDSAYDDLPFDIQAEAETQLFALADGLTRGSRAAVEQLARVLVLCGFGVCAVGSSDPGSQAEHLISHYVDMLDLSTGIDGRAPLHGEQVGVATLTMARLQWLLLQAREPPRLAPTRVDADRIAAHFGRLGTACVDETRAKVLDASTVERLNAELAARWESLRTRLLAVAIAPRELEAILRRAGAATSPAEIGLSRAAYRDAIRHARFIRHRFTFLDLADDAGLLDGFIAGEA